ncbi:hypothetical protein [Rickettsia endosymbiont of Polydrusus tereticollis]|uniref:hypothetical protein n=1 Tax=Rickettsia endosymbiont of Polydrusus tereticollis TaxID=3066251 RepID=UPI003132C095
MEIKIIKTETEYNQTLKEIDNLLEAAESSEEALISHEEYEKFNQLEDMYWVMQAKNASKKGFLSEKESAGFLAKILE